MKKTKPIFQVERFEKLIDHINKNPDGFDYSGMEYNASGLVRAVFPEICNVSKDYPSIDDCASFFGLTFSEATLIFWSIEEVLQLFGLMEKITDITDESRVEIQGGNDSLSAKNWVIAAKLWFAEKTEEKARNSMDVLMCPDCCCKVEDSVGMETHKILECVA